MADENFIIKTTDSNLRFTINENGVTDRSSLKQIKKAKMKLDLMRRVGIHEGNITSAKMLQICKAFIVGKLIYAIHLIPSPMSYEEHGKHRNKKSYRFHWEYMPKGKYKD